MDKKQIYIDLQTELEFRIKNLESIIHLLQGENLTESKSSAGDKHETSVSMNQLEQEKISNQIQQLHLHQKEISAINPEITSTEIHLGSFLSTNIGSFYISTGLGKINRSVEFFAINKEAPLVKELLGKKKGDEILFNKKLIRIIDVD
jgi:hypothetical protein